MEMWRPLMDKKRILCYEVEHCEDCSNFTMQIEGDDGISFCRELHRRVTKEGIPDDCPLLKKRNCGGH